MAADAGLTALGTVLGGLAERPGCPKRMVFGPCGGVRADLRCELADHPCPFVVEPAPAWPLPAETPAAAALPAAPGAAPGAVPGPVPGIVPGPSSWAAPGRPLVVTDLTVRPYDLSSVRAIAATLAAAADVLLVGEHHNRPDFPPTMMAAAVREAGSRAIVTLTCRDRNRLVLEQELAGLAQLADPAGEGVAGVLCVTGDGRGRGVRPGVTQVFDVDGPRLAAMARAAGLLACVPESPQAPPVDARPARLALKQAAGAGLCILNHVSSPAVAASFVGRARALGVTMPFVASVAAFSDARSAQVLAQFPGLHLDPASVDAVLASRDPERAGVEHAVAEARALLAIPGVIGINVSGLGSARGLDAAAEVKAAVGRGIRQL